MNRYDFIYLFDAKDANPNGDPDAGNMPRVDPETGHGTCDRCLLKRKIRNYVSMTRGNQPPNEIYFTDGAVLNKTHERAYEDIGEKPAKKAPSVDKARELTAFMCRNFFDIRTFGAVMSTEVNCGQVRGPVQLSFARSVDPVVTLEHTITRNSVTNERDLEKERTMGRKFTIPTAPTAPTASSILFSRSRRGSEPRISISSSRPSERRSSSTRRQPGPPGA